MVQPPTLLTIRQFAEKHKAFPDASLRWHVFRAASNGLDRMGAIKRIGRRVYVVEERFFEWVEAQQVGRRAG